MEYITLKLWDPDLAPWRKLKVKVSEGGVLIKDLKTVYGVTYGIFGSRQTYAVDIFSEGKFTRYLKDTDVVQCKDGDIVKFILVRL